MKRISADKRSLPFGSSSNISDPETMECLENYRPNLLDICNQQDLTDKFCQRYKNWLVSTKENSYVGIDGFPYLVYSNATSESFDKFYMKNNRRRFRCFRAEYMYHQVAWRNSWPDWKYIEDEAIDSNDAVVISYPFSDTGNKHPRQDEILEECTRLNVPVLMDCVYSHMSVGLEFDLRHPCITDVTFSLSKIFPLAFARIGMRMTRTDDDDTMFVYQKISYNNRLGAALGLYFIENFDVDYIAKKYKPVQEDFCRQLEVNPSHTVFFATGDERYSEYNRGGPTNRLSFHRFMHLKTLEGIS